MEASSQPNAKPRAKPAINKIIPSGKRYLINKLNAFIASLEYRTAKINKREEGERK
jgi:hypothetical protein